MSNYTDGFRDDEFRETFGEGENLQQAFSDDTYESSQEPEAEQPQEPQEPQKPPVDPNSKGRPKWKGKYGLLGIPHILVTAVWLALILIIGINAGRMLWLCATDVLAFDREPIVATIVVEEDDTIDTIAVKLQDAGLIRYTGLFKLYAKISNAQEDIRPGTYQFNDYESDEEKVVYDYMALVSVMSPTAKFTVVEDLRVPEGSTCAQIFKLLEEKKVCTVKQLEEASMAMDLSGYWFLEGLEQTDRYCLEGYLFPDTYDFYEYDDPENVLKKMLNNFDNKFNESMRADLEELNETLAAKLKKNGFSQDYIDEHKYTVREVVIVASMIEKETANNLESYTISSVIYNRLTNPGKYPYLNIDATLVYALGGKNDLTEQDKTINSPYNTYNQKGLIPGPISNPSQNSLAAALQPEDTKYYFYAYDPRTEEHHFTKNYDDHLDFLAELKGQS